MSSPLGARRLMARPAEAPRRIWRRAGRHRQAAAAPPPSAPCACTPGRTFQTTTLAVVALPRRDAPHVDAQHGHGSGGGGRRPMLAAAVWGEDRRSGARSQHSAKMAVCYGATCCPPSFPLFFFPLGGCWLSPAVRELKSCFGRAPP
eukprot:9499192-Pyramimonas_sp.AAC.1